MASNWTQEEREAAVTQLVAEFPYYDPYELMEADGDAAENIAVVKQMELTAMTAQRDGVIQQAIAVIRAYESELVDAHNAATDDHTRFGYNERFKAAAIIRGKIESLQEARHEG